MLGGLVENYRYFSFMNCLYYESSKVFHRVSTVPFLAVSFHFRATVVAMEVHIHRIQENNNTVWFHKLDLINSQMRTNEYKDSFFLGMT